MPRDWFFINRIALSKFSDERNHLINAFIGHLEN